MNIETPKVDRPFYGVTELPDALGFGWGGYHVTEKMDGRWHVLAIGGSRIAGELMPDGRFFAFDLAFHNGADVRMLPRVDRLRRLDEFKLLRPAAPRPGESPAEFIARVLAAGGEGIVAQPFDAPWGENLFKVKRFLTFDLMVKQKDYRTGSLMLEDPATGEDRGKCACKARFEMVHVGDIVEVMAMKVHASGKLREPRFLRIRHDKMVQ